MKKLITIIVAVASLIASTTTAKANNTMNTNDRPTAAAAPACDTKVVMHTTMGDITLLLYGDTPAHMHNFVKLASEGYYDGLLFHRVIKDFMIQGGDPDSRNATADARLGMGDPDYKIDAEIVWPRRFHKRGALAAAREGDRTNPERRSSGSQFYIVTGRTFTAGQLDQMERRMQQEAVADEFNRLAMAQRDSIMAMRRSHNQAGLQALQEELAAKAQQNVAGNLPKFTPEQREAYTTVGGAPHLDRGYTVFGEVIDGMDAVDKIQNVATGAADRPIEDVKIISMKVVSAGTPK